MNKEDLIQYLEYIITENKENPFGPGRVTRYPLAEILTAANLLADLQGWKVHNNFCRKKHPHDRS